MSQKPYAFAAKPLLPLTFFAFAALSGLTGCTTLSGTPSVTASARAGDVEPTEPGVWFLEPKDGATVSDNFTVKFAVKGMVVEPAGDIKANSGHHHLLINLNSITAGEAVPFSPTTLHYGKAQTEAQVKLAPGTYKLTMQFANGAHQSYGSQWASSITVTVK